MSKNQIRTIVGLVIVFAAFTVLAFALPFKMNGLFWISYVFGVIAIAVQVYILKTAFAGKETAKSKFYGFPIARIGVVYLVVQVIVSLIFMALAAICPAWVGVFVDILLFAAAALGFIATDVMREEVERQEVKVQVDTTFMKNMRAWSSSLVDLCDNVEAKKVLEKLAEEFRYSDPVSGESTTFIEQKIEVLMTELESAVKTGKADEVVAGGKKVMTSLVERNRICKMGKR